MENEFEDLKEIQKEKMKELWNNEYDEIYGYSDREHDELVKKVEKYVLNILEYSSMKSSKQEVEVWFINYNEGLIELNTRYISIDLIEYLKPFDIYRFNIKGNEKSSITFQYDKAKKFFEIIENL